MARRSNNATSDEQEATAVAQAEPKEEPKTPTVRPVKYRNFTLIPDGDHYHKVVFPSKSMPHQRETVFVSACERDLTCHREAEIILPDTHIVALLQCITPRVVRDARTKQNRMVQAQSEPFSVIEKSSREEWERQRKASRQSDTAPFLNLSGDIPGDMEADLGFDDPDA